MNATPSLPEPWLRGTLTDVSAVPRAVLHALELAGEDLNKWCSPLTDAELNAQPHGLPSVAFQLRHIARSIDRLLTYAEGNALSAEQLDALRQESQPGASPQVLFDELAMALEHAAQRIRALAKSDLEQSRSVGKRALPPRSAASSFTLPTTPNATSAKRSPQRKFFSPNPDATKTTTTNPASTSS